jgi:hypothetical protein
MPGEDVGEKALLYTDGRNINKYSHYGNHNGGSSKALDTGTVEWLKQ